MSKTVKEVTEIDRTHVKEAVPEKKQVRVWADGCFDMVHFGHANALRQAKLLGDYLIVGVHSDEEIRKHKGPPVMTEKERYAMVRACKWVDEVVEDAPYTTDLADLDKYNVDFCVHGEDLSIDATTGIDSYHAVKAAGRFRYIKRTDSVSTTSLVDRLLSSPMVEVTPDADGHHGIKSTVERSPYTSTIHYVPTTRMITLFSDGRRPNPGDRVVYIDGAFDLFHYGHVEALRKCRELGEFVIAGIYEEDVVRRLNKVNISMPIQTLHERVLTVLQCRYVDEVVIGAPFAVTESLIKALGVTVVVHGRHDVDPVKSLPDIHEPYRVPKEMGIYREIDSVKEPTTSHIIQRVLDQKDAYEARNTKKTLKELKVVQTIKEMEAAGKTY